jgi:hypothetical protein
LEDQDFTKLDSAYLLGLIDGANNLLGDDPIDDEPAEGSTFTRRQLAVVRYLARAELDRRMTLD